MNFEIATLEDAEIAVLEADIDRHALADLAQFNKELKRELAKENDKPHELTSGEDIHLLDIGICLVVIAVWMRGEE